MAFTLPQRVAIREYLGWSQLFKQIDPRLEGQMDNLPITTPDAVTTVLALLADLGAVDAAIQNAALNNLTLSKAEDVNFFGPEQLSELRRHGRMKIQQLSIIFELEPKRDYYSVDDGMGGEIQLG